MSTNTSKKQETLVKGMAWLTAGSFISRLLGIVYIIPWYRWLGEHRAEANALFNMGYQVYANFLLISTIGLPTAVAKQIARYNVLGKEKVSYYLVREMLKLMLLMGLISAASMYFLSPLLAELSGSREKLTPVMHSLVPPLLIFPIMSIIRGFFQGYHNLKPSAISQVIEQIFRVIWILVATYTIMFIGSGDYLQAVTQSTFAAFIGMLASLAILLITLYRQGHLTKIIYAKPADIDLSIKELIWETVKEAIPIIILGMAFQIYQFIDQITFVKTMERITNHSNTELLEIYSYMVSNPSKITMLIIGVTGSLAGVALPLLTETFTQKDLSATGKLFTDNLQILFIVIIPAIVGTTLLSTPVYTIFYGPTPPIAIHLFVANLFLIFVQGIYAILGITIQAISQNRSAIISFFIGLALKIALQVPMLYLFQVYGSFISTAIGLSISIYLFYKKITQNIPVDLQLIYRDLTTINFISLAMGIVVALLEIVLYKFLPPTSYLNAFIHIAISGSLGIAIFVILALKTRQLDPIIGKKADGLRRKLKIS